MSKTQTTLSIDKITKQKAEQVAKNMHLTLSGVTRILLNDFADGKIKITTVMIAPDENGFTAKEREELDVALQDISKGKNIEGPFNSAEEFITSLKK